VVRLVREQQPAGVELEVLVVDDGSTDRTAAAARAAGASVLSLGAESSGNPAIARNRGAAATSGDLIVFLDSDCTPRPGWLAALLGTYCDGVHAVGGSMALPPGLSFSARCDYYCGWYNHHERLRGGFVKHHPPGNLSVRRKTFERTTGFYELQPIAFAHEELYWQAEMLRRGERLYFEPRAAVDHHNRAGIKNLLRRSYRWGYSAIESKAETGVARMGWVYRHPWLLLLGSLPIAFLTTTYIVLAWLRALRLEPVLMLPLVLAARLCYSAGLVTGGMRWLRTRGGQPLEHRPQWE